jgi:hypothetical protein
MIYLILWNTILTIALAGVIGWLVIENTWVDW